MDNAQSAGEQLPIAEVHPLVIVHDGREILRLERSGKLIIDPQNVDAAAQKLVEAVHDFSRRMGLGNPFAPLVGEDDIERVARAMHNARYPKTSSDHPDLWEQLAERSRDMWRASARGGLAALNARGESATK